MRMSLTYTRHPLSILPTDPQERPAAVLHHLLDELNSALDTAQNEGVIQFVDAIDLRNMVQAALRGDPAYVTDGEWAERRLLRAKEGAGLRLSSCGVNWKTSAPAAPDQERQGQP